MGRRRSVAYRRTGFDLRVVVLSSKFDVHEVDLQLLVRLDTNQQGRSTTSGDDLIGVVDRLEDECKRALELFQHRLYELGESDPLVGLRVVDVLDELRNGLGIGLCLEHVSAFLQDEPKLSTVGDDAVVNDTEFVLLVGANGMAVALRRRSVGCPTGVGDGNLGHEDLVDVDGAPRDLLAQASDLSDFLEEYNFAWLVAVNAQPGRVVSSVLLAGKASAKDLKDLLTALKVHVSKSE